MKKLQKTNELFWLLGNIFCAFGIAVCTKSGLGLSMIAAPPFIINQFLIRFSPFFTQGASEYIFQAVLLIIMCLITKKFKWKYLLSFATAFFFGNMVDFALWVCGGQGLYETMVVRVIAFIVSEIMVALAIACYFRTSLPLCVYELFVVAVAEKFNVPSHKIKMIFDYSMLAISIILTLCFFGKFVGVGIGTIILTLVNSHLIRFLGKILDKLTDNEPRFPKLVEVLKQ
ncbi:MAG: hypothetical protein J6V50_03345 [Clostridia bacterium]|nr:hypothetical protein [Clostridia bacterium]